MGESGKSNYSLESEGNTRPFLRQKKFFVKNKTEVETAWANFCFVLLKNISAFNLMITIETNCQTHSPAAAAAAAAA